MNETTNEVLTKVPQKRGRKPFVAPVGVVIDWTMTDKQIAPTLGVSPLTVFKLRHRSGAPVNKKGRRSKSVAVISPVVPPMV